MPCVRPSGSQGQDGSGERAGGSSGSSGIGEAAGEQAARAVGAVDAAGGIERDLGGIAVLSVEVPRLVNTMMTGELNYERGVQSV